MSEELDEEQNRGKGGWQLKDEQSGPMIDDHPVIPFVCKRERNSSRYCLVFLLNLNLIKSLCIPFRIFAWLEFMK